MAYGRIPESFIDDVLMRTDIVDLVDTRVKLKRAGKNYSACCPFHREKTPSFTVSREKQFYYCFGCGASGNAISFLMDYERKDFIDSLKELATRAGLEVPDTRDGDAPVRESQQPLYDTLEKAATYFEQQLRQHPAKEKAVSYFKKRGLTGQIAKHYRLGYAPPGWDNLLSALSTDAAHQKHLLACGLIIQNEQGTRQYDAMRDRVIFPIRDFRGRVIAFGGRVLTDEKPKYLNSPESPVFHKGQELYGLHEARQAPGKLTRVVVVEGYMDVVALAQYDITYAVATLGTATSTTHIERLFRLVPDIVFCFDGDDAGRRAAWRALESSLPALQDGKSASFLFLPSGEDPDSLVRKEGKARFEDRLSHESEPLADFLFRHLGEGLRLDTLEGRSRVAMLAKPLIATLPDGIFREMLLTRLAAITELEIPTLRAAVLDTPPLAPVLSTPSTPSAQAASPAFTAPPPYAKHRPFTPRPRVNPQARVVSLSDRAIRLLLQDPQQATLTSVDELIQLHHAPNSLLVELVAHIYANPTVSTPTLMIHWYGTEKQDTLADLAASEFLTPNDGLPQEFQDVLYRMRLEALEQTLRDSTDLDTIARLKRELEALRQR